jgi:hypothetical protein
MEYPKFQANNITERLGILAIASQVTSLGLIFRETPNSDVGIDAQIEYVADGNAIGKLIAVQAKSGRSYLNDKGNHFAFYPNEKHKIYWEGFPLPVVVMLHDPDTGQVYYSDARYYLSIPERERQYKYVPVFKSKTLNGTTKDDLFNTPSLNPGSFLDFPDLLAKMIGATLNDPTFPVSYFEIFAHSLTNLCRHSFFHMHLPSDIAEYNLSIASSPFGIGVGYATHEYLHGYVKFLIEQNLVQVDYSDFLIDWNEREMLPKFLAPLTSRGRGLIDFIREKESSLFSQEEYDVSVACERYVQLVYLPSDIQRFEKIKQFGSRFKSSNS